MNEEKYCHRYDTCWFIQKKNFYSGEEVQIYKLRCLTEGKNCHASKLSDIEFKILEREKKENIWKED